MSTETRLNAVEHRLERMAARMRHLEAEAGVEGAMRPEAAPSTPAPDPAPAESRQLFEPGPEPAGWHSLAPRTGASFEELFGGRVLAWIGGLAILLGAVLFLGMAISRDWIDEVTRIVIAMLGSVALLGVGFWLHEGKGRTEAARAAVGSAIFGLYATLIVATQTYELVAPNAGLLLAALIAAVGLAIAVRWSSQAVAAIGSLGALAAPLLVGIDGPAHSIGFVFLALAAITGIVIWRRWDWLVLGAFLVSGPQVLAWALSDYMGEGAVFGILIGLAIFWQLYLCGALGHELRSREPKQLPVASLLQLFFSSALIVGVGYHVSNVAGGDGLAAVWLFGCAAWLALLGGCALSLGIHREISSLLIAAGIAIAAFGLAQALDGPALVIAWAAVSAVLACLATRLDASPDPAGSNAERMLVVSGAFLVLAVGHALAVEAPPPALFGGVENLAAAAAAIAACAAAAFALQYSARSIHPAGATLAAFAGAASLVYLGSVLIVDTIGVDAAGEARQAGQVWLSAFWTVTGLAAVVWGLIRKSPSVRLGGLALLGIAITKVWTYDLAELDELARVLSFVGLGLLLLVGAFAYQRIRPGEAAEEREPEAGGA